MAPFRFVGLGLILSGILIGVPYLATQNWRGAAVEGCVVFVGSAIWYFGAGRRRNPLPPEAAR